MLLNLNQLGVILGLGPQPKYWAVGVFLVSLALFRTDLNLHRLTNLPLTWWAVGYLLCSALWFLQAHNTEAAMDGLMLVVTTCLYVLTALLTYPLITKEEWLWGVALWVGLLIAVMSVFLDYFMPGFLQFSEITQSPVDRAAGLYLNPNVASQTILMILACLLLRSSAWMSLTAALVALTGLLVTFSRGGLVSWLVLVTVAAVRGHFPRFTLSTLVVAAAAMMVSGSVLLDAASAWIGPENRNALDRLAWLLGQGGLTDFAAGEREWVAGFAWNEFLDAPVFGHGLGYTIIWNPGVGTHNMILRHLVEYGALGGLMFPLFLFCSVYSTNSKASRKDLWLNAAVILLLSVFSHNMLEQACFVLPWLACCLVGSSSEVSSQKPNRQAIS